MPIPEAKEAEMTQYLLSVHMVEGEEPPAPEEIEQMYADVDAVNDELKAQGAWVFAGVCTRRAPRRSCGRKTATC